jgi:hypothetical protein
MCAALNVLHVNLYPNPQALTKFSDGAMDPIWRCTTQWWMSTTRWRQLRWGLCGATLTLLVWLCIVFKARLTPSLGFRVKG